MTPKEMAIILDIESGMADKKQASSKNIKTSFKMISYKYKKVSLRDFDKLSLEALRDIQSSRSTLIFLKALKKS